MIPIIDNWVLIVDENCYTIAQYKGERPRKDGRIEKVLANQKYYTSLGKALEGFRGINERKILSGDFPDLTAAFLTLKKSNEELNLKFERIIKLLEGDSEGWRPTFYDHG